MKRYPVQNFQGYPNCAEPIHPVRMYEGYSPYPPGSGYGGYSPYPPESGYSGPLSGSSSLASTGGVYAPGSSAGVAGGNPWLPPGTPQNSEVLSWFQAVDQNGNGSISVSELNQALSSSGSRFSLATTERLLNRFDNDRDGEISFPEFEALHALIINMKNAFEARNKDKNGRLSGQEVRAALASRGYGLSEETFQALMRKFDRHRRGSLGFDDYVELSFFLNSVRDTFAFYDKDGSGTVAFNFDTFLMSSVSVISI